MEEIENGCWLLLFLADQPDCAWCFPFGEGNLVVGFSSSLAINEHVSMFVALYGNPNGKKKVKKTLPRGKPIEGGNQAQMD